MNRANIVAAVSPASQDVPDTLSRASPARAFVLPSLAFAAGVLILQQQARVPDFLPWLGLAVAAMLPGLRWRHPAVKVLLLLGCLLLGFSWAAWRAELRLDDHLGAAWEGKDVEVIGTVSGLPQDFGRGVRFNFAVDRVLTAESVLPSKIQLNWYRNKDFQPSVNPGERWRLTVRLKRPHGGANPGGFDYEVWLFERGIRATGYVRPVAAEKLADFVPSLSAYVETFRAHVRASFWQHLPPENYPWSGILIALAIGDQKAVEGELWSVFNRTGTTHLMSISGLHVTMVAGLFGWLVASVWRRWPVLALRYPAQRAGLIAAALGAAGYALLAGFGVPAQRTLYMLLVAALAMLSGRLIVPSQILAGALLVVLLVDPWAVLAPGFWLSFGAVAALLYIGASVVGEGRTWRDRMWGWGKVQWAATLASIPVLMAVFQQFSLVSPLANALAVPVISFVITPLALLAALLPWAPILWLAHALLDILMIFLIWCADWPLWQAPAPPLWTLPIAGLGIALCLLPRGVPGRWLGLLLLVPAVFWPVEPIPDGEARIDVLDVGQGQAVLIRTRDHVLIYDPGPQYSADADAGQRVVLPYLRWLGVNAVDILIITHGDADHAGGLASLQAGVPIRALLSSMPELAGDLCRNGQGWRWNGVDFAILHPDGDAYAESGKRTKRNSLSCVLKVSAGARSMLLTADIEAVDEFAMLRRNLAQLPADVLLAPHHGARGSSTQAFVDAVAAAQVIFSVGYRNRFGHPRPEIVDRYQSTAARLWRTDWHGAIRIKLAADKVEVSSWRQQHARYWHGR